MTLILAFLPILIVIVAIVIGFVIKNNKKRKSFLSSNLIIKLFGVYLLVVLVATMLYAFIPSSAFTEMDAFEDAEVLEPPQHQAFFQDVHEGRFEAIDESYVYERLDFGYDQSQIHVTSGKNDEHLGAQVLVERKDVNDGKIEVIHYATPTITDGSDIEEFRKMHDLHLEDDILRIAQPRPIEYKVTKFENEFVIRQFTGEKSMGLNLRMSALIGSEVIYLRIPKDLGISGEIVMIEK